MMSSFSVRDSARHGQGVWPVSVTVLALTALLLGIVSSPAAAISRPSESALWAGVRSGAYIAVMRHALAPGTGDPANFKLGDCTTQRNLSAEGRRQSVQIGARLKANGISAAAVYTSQWCRCRETARLLGMGPVRDLRALNSFWRDRARRGPQTRALRQWLTNRQKGDQKDRPAILVTHFVNIQALTGYAPASGEVVIVRIGADGRVAVAGTIQTR